MVRWLGVQVHPPSGQGTSSRCNSLGRPALLSRIVAPGSDFL